ncbi:MAG: ATP-dependent helicase [Mesorhizobium sp.]|uniref:UvrD-helicase domain-containing protein n=1 Tax=unclassified Mesorhizobium TaxID=325217 RepID=UPI000FCBD495|nr:MULTISPECIES: UvrD-helicase domain-containing protein [unclassified Mesorhizobium]RUV73467.1 ATP-dependent helicase [Mesorhizobium sp. M5C.F.Cr.IN.023.01.1.1]RWF86476.1 MAG: ATP-dependent helicase [Mesorhizobium sp.]RWF93801.1 MAG: ATP-dependent helicase [Mesorhizobium sp.]RWI35310.1 MAG: ATP-dependent helicase [Mesorhizobium sp.]RWI53716.1 MAG: ATP-dependent helicase [Mesorhizobium sp.]
MTETDLPDSNVTLDDHVEAQLAEFLNLENPKSFFLFAGAGSGKTRSLVNALRYLADRYRDTLRLRGRQVAVITYTNAACEEITRRTEYDPLFLVRTIHSFAWLQIQSFHTDIRKWLRINLQQEITEISEEEQKGRAGTKASASRLAQIESKQRRFARLDDIKTFTYNPNSDNRERNALNHSEVIKIFAAFLLSKPLMQRMFVEKYPFLLIDESQDTSKTLIDALLAVQQAHASRFGLGLIGDTMQRIYPDGKERIETIIPQDWATPEKKLNHRSPQRIVRLINEIREGADKQKQEPRTDAEDGWVRLFVFPVDVDDKPKMEDGVRAYMAQLTGDTGWNDANKCKILTLEHHMAAKRMGFQDLFEALASVDDFRTSFLDGSFSATRFFTHSVLPLVNAQKKNDKFAATKLVREDSPLLSKDSLKGSERPIDQLRVAQNAIDSLMALWADGVPTCGAILENVASTNLFAIPDSLKAALAARQAEPTDSPEDDQEDPVSSKIGALIAFLECSFAVIKPYAAYVAREASFDTHQGVKGLEFDRVMVLMDDGDARGFLFGYDKLLGAKAPTAADLRNAQEGKETSLDRTRRLFYVTCSRAKSSLALVAYSPDPAAVRTHVIANGWFEENEVISELN